MGKIILIGTSHHVQSEIDMILHHPVFAGKTVILANDVKHRDHAQKLELLHDDLKSIPIVNHRHLVPMEMPQSTYFKESEKSNYITGKKLPRRNRS